MQAACRSVPPDRPLYAYFNPPFVGARVTLTHLLGSRALNCSSVLFQAKTAGGVDPVPSSLMHVDLERFGAAFSFLSLLFKSTTPYVAHDST